MIKRSKYTTPKRYQMRKEGSKILSMNKGLLKQSENNELNGSMKFLSISDYFKCKWTKLFNQKT